MPSKRLPLLISAILVLFGLAVFRPELIQAQSEADLRSRTAQLEAEISAKQEIVHDLENRANTLQARLEQLQAEVGVANQQIELTSIKIGELEVKLEETTKELERQEALLAESIRTLYKTGDLSTIELLAASESFSEFIDGQEYMERLKAGIQKSADAVEVLKKEIESEKVRQEGLLAQQQAQRQVLTEKKAEQAQLLEQTRGEEARYQAILADLDQQRQDAERELQEFLARQNFVSYGSVKAGSMLGQVGSSGFSTGPHIHFAIYENGGFIDPVAGTGVLTYGMQWPVPNSSWADISQFFGCGAPYDWYLTKCGDGTSFHSGLDISGWYGDPIIAAADGEIIFRGWMGGYGNTVILDHGNGVYTYYPHMLE